MLAEKLSGLPALKELTLVGRQSPWPMTDYQMLNGLKPLQIVGFAQPMLAALCALEGLKMLHLEDWKSTVFLARYFAPALTDDTPQRSMPLSLRMSLQHSGRNSSSHRYYDQSISIVTVLQMFLNCACKKPHPYAHFYISQSSIMQACPNQS